MASNEQNLSPDQSEKILYFQVIQIIYLRYNGMCFSYV